MKVFRIESIIEMRKKVMRIFFIVIELLCWMFGKVYIGKLRVRCWSL